MIPAAARRTDAGPVRLHGFPIWVQILGLLIGGLVAAQLVTLALTVLLPPAPPQQHSLSRIAEALRGGELSTGNGRPLIRTVETAPPSLQSPGWVVSEASTAELVHLLGARPGDVRLLFYAPPPLAGTAPASRGAAVSSLARPQVRYAGFMLLDQAGPGRIGGGGPPPPGVMGPPPGAIAGRVPGGLGGVLGGSGPASLPRGVGGPPPGAVPTGIPGGVPQVRRAPGAIPSTPTATTGPAIQRDAGPPPAAAAAIAAGAAPADASAGPASGGGPLRGAIEARAAGPVAAAPAAPPILAPHLFPREVLGAAALAPVRAPPPGALRAAPIPAPVAAPPPAPRPPETLSTTLPAAPPVVIPAAPTQALVRAAPALAAAVPIQTAPIPSAPAERALAAPDRPTVFGLARAAYVEGEFVAALRNADGRWTTVRPQPETFPNSWQRRVLLWFALAFAVVAPLGVIMARRLAAPLNEFAAAAERLGRDPSADLTPLTGPAEVGRAAKAFNLMRTRLKRYIEDRTGMIGAISHDLRTPLARMRFKLERVPPGVRAALDRDIRQMEEMIESVLSFMRDETAASGRERVDLRSILECVVDEADGAAELAPGATVEVEIDLLGFQRVFENLVGNAVKYGERAHVRMWAHGDEAVVEIADDGQGLDDAELEQVFKPFYRSTEALASGKAGVGLGLAVSRSTVRAHGGDLTLRRGERGLVAEVRIPLSRVVSLAA